MLSLIRRVTLSRPLCQIMRTRMAFIIVAGQPLDQKVVVQYGPFVLNSQEEVYQAMLDYQTASNGFEKSRNWQSEIGKRMAY